MTKTEHEQPTVDRSPSQTAYEAWADAARGYLPTPGWHKLTTRVRRAWDAAVNAAAAPQLDALRRQVQQDRNAYYEAACEHSEMAGHEEQEARASGRVSAYDDVLAMLAEAGTGSEGSEGR